MANPDLPEGTEQVVQEGADGVRTSIYEVVWSGGEELSRQFVEELDSTAVDEVVEYGTAAGSTASRSMPGHCQRVQKRRRQRHPDPGRRHHSGLSPASSP